MISVLIADDETLVRSTLRKLIPWQELGVEAVYEAEDGLRGLLSPRSIAPPSSSAISKCLTSTEWSSRGLCAGRSRRPVWYF